MGKRTAKELDGMATRYSKRLRFASAIRDGLNITQASNAAGITRQTGRVWKRMIAGGEFVNTTTRDASLTKQETEELVAEIARNKEVPAAYRINAMSLSADLGGHKAATRSLIEVRTVPASVIGWLDSTYGALPSPDAVKALPLVPPGEPPTDAAEFVQPPLTDSAKSEGSVDVVNAEVEVIERAKRDFIKE